MSNTSPKQIFWLISILFILISCDKNKASQSNTEKETAQPEATTDATNHKLIDELITSIDAETEQKTPKEYTAPTVNDYACEIKDFDRKKKQIYCFDGGFQAREILVYYDKDSIMRAAIYSVEKFNASPANLAEYDESKTSRTRYKLILKENRDPMYISDIESVFDENNKEIELNEKLLTEWNEFTAAIPPY